MADELYVYGSCLAWYMHRFKNGTSSRMDGFVPYDVNVLADGYVTREDESIIRQWAKSIGLPSGMPLNVKVDIEDCWMPYTPFKDESGRDGGLLQIKGHAVGTNDPFVGPGLRLSTCGLPLTMMMRFELKYGSGVLTRVADYDTFGDVDTSVAALVRSWKYLGRHYPRYYHETFEACKFFAANLSYWPFPQDTIEIVDGKCCVRSMHGCLGVAPVYGFGTRHWEEKLKETLADLSPLDEEAEECDYDSAADEDDDYPF